ncbi:MAG: anti-sigma factor antagonist [Candidatus Aminicenantes bacterium]|jgi:anti-anti-sigma regulatory factor|nr:anti-sigma factor antagonist [Candidatus Aminicenantes bacterium]
MLRITVKKEGKKARVLRLEGKICQEWIKELEAEISQGLDEGKKIILDFSEVGFMDEEAADMINRFPLQNVEKRNGSLFIRTMLKIDDRGEK